MKEKAEYIDKKKQEEKQRIDAKEKERHGAGRGLRAEPAACRAGPFPYLCILTSSVCRAWTSASSQFCVF